MDNIEFENDKIFLLSVEEYEKYKNVIPQINAWWWLRSPGYFSDCAASVRYVGSVGSDGDCVNYNIVAVRPAIKINTYDYILFNNGDRIVIYDFPWIKIADDLAIAEVPIGFHKFDEKSNDYETSEIRQFLLNWIKQRKEIVNL